MRPDLSTKTIRRGALTLVLMIALYGPQIALADEAHEKALEARVAELERLVNQLVTAQKAPPPVAPSAPKAAPAGGKAPIQDVAIAPGSPANTTFKFGGFIKADFMETRTNGGQIADSSAGRDLYLPSAIPVGGRSSHTDFDAGGKFSRFNLGVDSVLDTGDKIGAFVEMDFFGGALGTEVATNTYGVTLRHAYAYWNGWTAGQTWSNFMDTGALPDAVDFIGPTDGVVFVRQPQIRYATGGFSVALENPETTLLPYRTGAKILSDRGGVPDLTLRYGWKGGWGSFGVGALLRDLQIDTQTAPIANDSKFTGALTVGGKWNIGANNDIRYQLTGGSGIGRYIGLGITGDGELDATGNIQDLSGLAGYIAWRHAFSNKLRFNLMYARSDYDNDAALTGLGVTKSVQSGRVNLIYSPLPKLDVGAEFMYGKRELESGADGKLDRLQFTVKYTF